MEVWPDLLEELLELDRDAWNAVRVVAPLELEGDVLTIGLASESDLAAFKTTGAGPLRETIMSAVGISVKYKPKRMPAGNTAAGHGSAREPGTAADAEEPHQAGRLHGDETNERSTGSASAVETEPQPESAPAPDPNDPMVRAAARLSGLGPALAAPAWADPLPDAVAASPSNSSAPASAAAPAPSPSASLSAAPSGAGAADGASDAMPDAVAQPTGAVGEVDGLDERFADPASFGDPYAGDPGEAPDDSAEGDPYATVASAAAPERDRPAPAPSPEPPAASAPGPAASASAHERDAAPTPAADQAARPAFTRYGESVVREVLGARFVEERPLPPR